MDDFHIDAFCGGLFQTNGYFVRSGASALLFDAPEGMADWLEGRGLKPGALVLTHQHHDHVVDAGAVARRFGCPVWAHSPSSPDLTLVDRLEIMTGLPCTLEDYSVDRLLVGEAELVHGDLACDLFHVPGHSPDSLCFLLRGHPVLVGGDVLFQGSIGRTDFPHGDHEQLVGGIREILWPLPDGTHVLPGHGPATTIGAEKAHNPFL